ncbi:MAG: 6,7-dimethyl-8-ribityllumazine synthase [Gemmataceae bacterium]
MNRFAVIVARFNSEITEKLLAGSVQAFGAEGVPHDLLEVIHVPGAFELPLVAKTMALSGQYAAIVCLGAVIRGDTDHYDYVCQAAMHGILLAGLETGIPVIFGVLTCNTDEQALARCGGAEGNKGADAARAAIEITKVMQQIG